MSNAISSAIFCVRGVNKAETQDKPFRAYIAAGQAAKVFDQVSKLDNVVGRGARASVDAFKVAAQGSKALDYAGKALGFLTDNINPLICISAGIDVLNSDNPTAAVVTNGTALASMFTVESLMKKHLDEIPKMSFMKGITEKVMKFATKHGVEGKLPTILHGVAFVVGSCAAYSVGEKFGDLLVGKKSDKN